MASPFVHLHLHSQYSLLDGFIEFDRLLQRVKEFEMPAVALTDHGNMFGALEFYKRARKAEVKPIIGCEVYITTGDRRDHSKESGKTHHLLLLSQNRQGYNNLCALVSQAYFEGFYYKPRLDWEILAKHSAGLIATSSCLRGEVPSLLLAGMEEAAEKKAKQYRELFGDNFYLELQDHGLEGQKRINPQLQSIAKRLSLGMVATNDCHYVLPTDARHHDVLLCIQSGKTVEDEQRLRFHNNEFYLKSATEMQERFAAYPEALTNTVAIANQVDLEFKFGSYLFPSFPTQAGLSLDESLTRLARSGFAERWEDILASYEGKTIDAAALKKTYEERLAFELSVIQKMGFSGYFLIVADFIAYAKNQAIPVGPGRGSAAGSLVAYALKITDVDPLPYHLLFERFLNPERISMPDIDIDFCVHGRDKVIRYVANKYGGESGGILHEKVAQIITFGKMKARAVIRDVGRALNMPYSEVDRIAKLVPFAINITLKEAFEQEPKFAQMRQESRQIDELLTVAESLEGMVRHASTHAAGVVISDDHPLVDHMPLFQGTNGEVTTQYDMKVVEEMGLIKFDFLGLKTLTVLQRALELISKNHGVEINLNRLNMSDPAVFYLLSSGDTTGIFQLESSGMRDLITRLKPNSFEDVIALVALYRPGPLGSGMVDDFIKRKHGLIPIEFSLPELKEILRETYGVILYQEQVMQIAVKLASYSMADADVLRKAMGKKVPEVMLQQKEKFMRGALHNNIHTGKAEQVFDLMVAFGGYGFNKSHSAAYALIAYQTAYLKAHFPVEFMTALLSEDLDNTDKVITYITNCHEMRIDVLPPHVNRSRFDFEAVDGKIVFGLGAIKNVGQGAIEAILEGRDRDGIFTGIVDLAKRVDLNKVNRKVFEALIKCGALDDGKLKRSQMFAALDRVLDSGQRQQRQSATGQASLFDALPAPAEISQQSWFPTIEEWDEKVRLNFEREAVGFYLSGHPLTRFAPLLKRLNCTEIMAVHALEGNQQKKTVAVGAMVSTVKEITTKRGDRMAFVTLEDLTGSIEAVIFSDVYAQSKELLKSDEPLCLRGTVDLGEEKNKLIVQKVGMLTEAQTSASQLHIRLHESRLPESKLQMVREIFLRHPGSCETYLHLRLEDDRIVTLALPRESWVQPSDALASELSGALGSGSAYSLELI